MTSLVGDEQASFVPRRQILDNIDVVQQITHSMRAQKRKTNTVAIKVDLEKAYDQLWWDFIKETLVMAGLSGLLIDLIM